MLKIVQIKLLYFGVLKDFFECAGESLELEESCRVEDAIRLLRGRASKRQEEIWASLAVAVNREYCDISKVLCDGDEVALLPPVSGGSISIKLRVSK